MVRPYTVGAAAPRDPQLPTVAPVARDWGLGRISEALTTMMIVAAVVTENGRIGETPLGIITAGIS
ncbi:MAG: hypothetical protein R2849_01350 [Thermomicrobiales bacterium]